jgi:hypothetical protein
LQEEQIVKLSFFAEISQQPLATKALEYIQKGLEADEDLYWLQIAEDRYKDWKNNSDQTSLSFEEVWQKHIPSDSCQS